MLEQRAYHAGNRQLSGGKQANSHDVFNGQFFLHSQVVIVFGVAESLSVRMSSEHPLFGSPGRSSSDQLSGRAPRESKAFGSGCIPGRRRSWPAEGKAGVRVETGATGSNR